MFVKKRYSTRTYFCFRQSEHVELSWYWSWTQSQYCFSMQL